jgi:deoxyribodipyrimidine photolyase-related protein
MMNIGLLTDNEVIEIVLKYQDKIPISSFEGFIRQIIGWRNYMYTLYILEGDSLVKSNFLNHKNKLNKKIMWSGETKLLPLDNIINKIVNYGYAHHIERLMYLGNYMLLCMINPKDVYEIFMEWTIDAYDWVMVPNVYGMSQYCDGGNIMTRPYFSSSNYILKMSDYKKGEWCKIWDALYYNFINTHQKMLEKNYATSRQVAFWKKKTEIEKKRILKTSKDYLDNIL